MNKETKYKIENDGWEFFSNFKRSLADSEIKARTYLCVCNNKYREINDNEENILIGRQMDAFGINGNILSCDFIPVFVKYRKKKKKKLTRFEIMDLE